VWEDFAEKIYRGEKILNLPEARITCKDGQVRDVRAGMALADNFNLVIYDDITQAKRAQEEITRLATVVKQAVEAIFITDLDGKILYANPATEKITGYLREEIIGKTPRFLKSDQHDARFYQNLWETLKRGKTWHGRFINRRKDGSLYEEDAIISPIRNAEGEVINYVAIKHDVSREVQLEAQFRQAQKMEAIGTLAGGIAHDFNNILMAVFACAGILRNELGAGEHREMVEEILKSANRAKDLVQQILTFSRQREQKREIIQIEPIVKEATKLLVSSKPVDITVHLKQAPNLPPVLADSTQVYQIVMNLTTNAVHAMEGQSGQLSIELSVFTPDEQDLQTNPKFRPTSYVRLSVADTGHGMEAQTLERIFDPFFTTKMMGKGTGLGLAVVHGIVQNHEGVITVDSRPGLGSIFNIYLPAQPRHQDSPCQPTSDLPVGNGQSVLVIDDEPTLANIFERLLNLLHYRPVACTQPKAALAIFQKDPQKFSAVITDLAMPEMNGLHLAREIRARHAEIPIILVSGFTANLTPEEIRAAGICQLIEKPASIAEVAQALHHHLKN
jgi:PAS domain S-box-containing protein